MISENHPSLINIYMAANFANQIFKIKIQPTFVNDELFLSLSKA